MKLSALLCIFLTVFSFFSQAQDEPIRVIVIGAHPDDCDIDAGATAALLASMGHAVKFLSVTNGDAGHQTMGGGELARIRKEEAREAGRRLGIDAYEVLGNHDGELVPSLAVRQQVIRKIRQWNADVVLNAGTWTLELLHVTGPDRGDYTVQLDDGAGSFTTIGGWISVYPAASARSRKKLMRARCSRAPFPL